MPRWFLVVAVGCGREVIPAGPRPDNLPPTVEEVEAYCGWDEPAYDFLWTFRARVSDLDGSDDVQEVSVHVYDEVADVRVVAWGLPAAEGDWWGAVWGQTGTPLWCGYEHYSADFVATDSTGESDVAIGWVPYVLAR